jgi:ATP-dependent DNA ligase
VVYAPVQTRTAALHPAFPSEPLSKQPSTGEVWVHEVKDDGYRLQVHVRAGRVHLFMMNAADWTERYPPRVVEDAPRLKGDAVLDCEVICIDEHGARTSIGSTYASPLGEGSLEKPFEVIVP